MFIKAVSTRRKAVACFADSSESLHTTRMDPAHAAAARSLLAFWRAVGVDMDLAEAVFAARAPVVPPASSRQEKKSRQDTGGTASVDNARTLAQAAQTIADLRAAVEAFNGCALKATARNTVFSDGVMSAEVLLIGEYPGKAEDEQGKPFVGRPGQLLDRMLSHIGLDRRSNILISNIVYWRPPGDRDPTQGEIVACLPFVERLIELAQPKLLLLTGKAAAHTLLKREDGVMKLRGRRLVYSREGRVPVNAMVMLHPAYLLRQPQQKRLAWGDLLLAEAWLEELGVVRSAHR